MSASKEEDFLSPFWVRKTKDFVAFRFVSFDGDVHAVKVVFQQLHAAFLPLGARPHWGYLHFFSPQELSELYQARDVTLFWEQVHKLDPRGAMLGEFLRALRDVHTPEAARQPPPMTHETRIPSHHEYARPDRTRVLPAAPAVPEEKKDPDSE